MKKKKHLSQLCQEVSNSKCRRCKYNGKQHIDQLSKEVPDGDVFEEIPRDINRLILRYLRYEDTINGFFISIEI